MSSMWAFPGLPSCSRTDSNPLPSRKASGLKTGHEIWHGEPYGIINKVSSLCFSPTSSLAFHLPWHLEACSFTLFKQILHFCLPSQILEDCINPHLLMSHFYFFYKSPIFILQADLKELHAIFTLLIHYFHCRVCSE